MQVKIGDVVCLNKRHSCGSNQWRVTRLGADIGLRCCQCDRRVLLERGVFEGRLKGVVADSVDIGGDVS